jgi:glycosyltransferase involved in cell wall biosynthesis
MKWPTVSCICITRNRRLLLRQAFGSFLRSAQPYLGSYPQLVIVDGSDQPRPSLFSSWNVDYHHRPSSILQAGLAHNEACEIATGDIVIQWDDDDWQSPHRIARQVEALMTSPGDGLAFSSRYYHYHLEQRLAVKSKSWLGGEGSTGALFAYWKDTWRKTPFDDVPVGEDIPFQAALRTRGCPMLDMKDPELVVYVRHNQNGSAMTQYQWDPVDTADARALMGNDVDFYDGLGELMPVANWNHPNAPGSKAHVMSPIQQQWMRHYR